MSKVDSLNYIYCPNCARTLEPILVEGKPRKHCYGCDWTHYPTPPIGVAAIVTRIADDLRPSVLMVKRKRAPYEGTWMFPAGFLEWGEHPEDTLSRDALKEEVGLTLVSSKLITIGLAEKDPRYPNHLVLFYHVETTGEIKNNDADENSEIEWQPIYSNIKIGFPHHIKVMKKIKSDIRYYFAKDLERLEKEGETK